MARKAWRRRIRTPDSQTLILTRDEHTSRRWNVDSTVDERTSHMATSSNLKTITLRRTEYRRLLAAADELRILRVQLLRPDGTAVPAVDDADTSRHTGQNVGERGRYTRPTAARLRSMR